MGAIVWRVLRDHRSDLEKLNETREERHAARENTEETQVLALID